MWHINLCSDIFMGLLPMPVRHIYIYSYVLHKWNKNNNTGKLRENLSTFFSQYQHKPHKVFRINWKLRESTIHSGKKNFFNKKKV